MRKPEIKCILLDIGDVLLHVDWDQFSRHLGFSNSDVITKIRESKTFDSYERGQIAPTDFFKYIKTEFTPEHSVNDIAKAWDSIILGEIPGVGDLIQKYASALNSAVNVNSVRPSILFYALTNASPTHIELEAKKYSMFKDFKKILTSYELGFRKPDPEIYLAALKEMNCRPEEVLFVDDLPENVAGAKAMGIHAEECRRSAEKLAHIFDKYVG